jgi:hypothetical protein
MPANSTPSKRHHQIALYLVLPAVLIALGVIGWMMAIENSTLVLRSVNSPDGLFRAEVVREDPGASSNYQYMVRVMPAGISFFATSLRRLPLDPVYVALDAHHEPDKLVVQWTGPREVTIHCDGCRDAETGRDHFRGVTFKYELK